MSNNKSVQEDKKKKPTSETKKSKIDYKKKYEELKKQHKHLQLDLFEQKRQNEMNVEAFKDKAKEFSKKAQEEVDKIKKSNHEKLENEKKHIKKYASQDLLESILDPILNIEVAVNAGSSNDAVRAYVQGFKMLLNQLDNEMSNHGITKIEPKIGDEFDPKIHYAISKKPGAKNKIVEVKKMGFKLHDRAIKPAVVIVGE